MSGRSGKRQTLKVSVSLPALQQSLDDLPGTRAGHNFKEKKYVESLFLLKLQRSRDDLPIRSEKREM